MFSKAASIRPNPLPEAQGTLALSTIQLIVPNNVKHVHFIERVSCYSIKISVTKKVQYPDHTSLIKFVKKRRMHIAC